MEKRERERERERESDRGGEEAGSVVNRAIRGWMEKRESGRRRERGVREERGEEGVEEMRSASQKYLTYHKNMSHLNDLLKIYCINIFHTFNM